MPPQIQKQQQILKQNLSKFENRATQITYSLNKIQYLLYNCQESEQNKDFIKSEYRFLQSLVAQVGDDLDAFENNNNVLAQLINNSSSHDHPYQNGITDDIKVEEEEEEMNEKEVNSQSNYDEMEEDDDDEYDEQQSQQKSHHHQGVSTRKKNIDKDKIYSSGYQNNSQTRNNHHTSNNYSSSLSESMNYKDYNNANTRQIRKKKYSSELRKKLVLEITKKNFSYRKICKKYNINYGTAYYLVNSIQKEMADTAAAAAATANQTASSPAAVVPPPAPVVIEGGNNSVQKSNLTVNPEQKENAQASNGNPSTTANTKPATTSAPAPEKSSETGRNKYSEEFKQKLYVESCCGLSYKDASDKYGISYETCYYLINTIRNQATKDSALNRQLKQQIAQYQEQHETTKASTTPSAKQYNSKVNTIPTTTTLTRAQQAILNGTTNQTNEKKIEQQTIAIDDEDSEHEIEIDDRLVNFDEKGDSSIHNSKHKSEEMRMQIAPNISKEEKPEEGEDRDKSSSDGFKVLDQRAKEEGDKEDEMKIDSTTNEDYLKQNNEAQSKKENKKSEQDQQKNTFKKDQLSQKVGGSAESESVVMQ